MTANVPNTDRSHIAALSLPATVGGPQVLLPAGEFSAPRGAMIGGAGPWRLPASRGVGLAAALVARHSDIPIDYEHQILRSASNGQPAPAAGWIPPSAIGWDPSRGLIASQVRWTERAAAAIGGDEYRYLSPVFTFDPSTGEVADLLHVALTNTPALDLPEVTLAALTSLTLMEASAVAEMASELRGRVLALLSLPDTSTDADIASALDSLQSTVQSTEGAAASLPDLLRTHREQLAALTAQVASAPTPALVAELQGQIAALTAASETRERDAMLAAARADGRLLPGSALDTHCSGLPLAALSALLPGLTPIAALNGTQTGGHPPAGVAAAAAATDDLAQFGGSAELRDAYYRAEAQGRVRIYGGPAK